MSWDWNLMVLVLVPALVTLAVDWWVGSEKEDCEAIKPQCFGGVLNLLMMPSTPQATKKYPI